MNIKIERTYCVSKQVTSTIEVDEHLIGEINAMINLHVMPNYHCPKLVREDIELFLSGKSDNKLQEAYPFRELDGEIELSMFEELEKVFNVLFNFLGKDKTTKDDEYYKFRRCDRLHSGIVEEVVNCK